MSACLHRPKSLSLICPVLSIKILSGFKSLWMYPILWMLSIAAIWIIHEVLLRLRRTWPNSQKSRCVRLAGSSNLHRQGNPLPSTDILDPGRSIAVWQSIRNHQPECYAHLWGDFADFSLSSIFSWGIWWLQCDHFLAIDRDAPHQKHLDQSLLLTKNTSDSFSGAFDETTAFLHVWFIFWLYSPAQMRVAFV